MADTDLLDYAGLKHYDSKIKACMWNWQKTKKAGAVAFKPVPESDLEPVVDFLFTETLPAEGEKGPENPSTITGVASASLWLAGKNISFTTPYYNFVDGERTINGVTFKANADGSVTVSGTATSNANCALYNSNSTSLYGTPIGVGTWRLSGCPAGGSYNSYAIQPVLAPEYGSSSAYDYGSGSTITVTKTGAKIGIVLRIASGYTAQNLVFKPQIELASAATEYEQPEEKQEYTLSLGSTCYGGSLDVATGAMTVTHMAVAPAGETVDISSAPAALPLEYADTYGRDISSADGSSLSVGSSGGTVVYRLASPQTVQLTPQQIRSLPALDKYEPRINTVYTDQEAVQVGYQRFYDENRLASIESRLDALEA